MRIAYVRVSASDQNEGRQKEALRIYDIERWYEEKISGKDMQRPQLRAMLDYMRKGDIVYIMDFSRLARSTKDLLDIVSRMESKGVTLISLKEKIDTSTDHGRLLMTIVSAINEFERATILDRQAEGIALAKAAGKYEGRKKIKIKHFEDYYHRYSRKLISKAGLSRELGVSRPTIDRLIREHEERLRKTEEKKMVPGQLSIDWDPDFTKTTAAERESLEKSDSEMKNGDYISEEDFWA